MTLIRSRFFSLALFAAVFLASSLALRIGLFVRVFGEADTRLLAVLGMFGVGMALDLVACCVLLLPLTLLLIVLPDGLYRRRPVRYAGFVLYGLAVAAIIYDLPVEWFFWTEFNSRFNFFAVDYLIYTNEVLGNIWESYPVVPVTAAALGLAGLVIWRTGRVFLRSYDATSTWRGRLKAACLFLVAPACLPLALAACDVHISDNAYTNELAKNGLISFARAFFANSVDYDRYYLNRPPAETFARLRPLLAEPNSTFVSGDPFDVRRQIRAAAPDREQRLNVVVVVVESLGANYLGCFGSDLGLTPNLDQLADDSLVFRELYATGTRTVRGLEALSLSLPPTPGGSVVKQAGSGRMFSAGGLFASRGYRSKFVYAGFGYFDNMNGFFRVNGCRIIDRSAFARDEITFSNIWGVCDGDLYRRVLREADASHAARQPFFTLVMTTSNHRPYTYPAGLIDISPGSRAGAVKYTDYAIGQFLRDARARPWFADTLFVIVADHCASSAGRFELPVEKYHIPAFIYSPAHVKPGQFAGLCSQIDLMPTVLGLLNWSYMTRFFGRDVNASPPNRALLGTYQKLGLLVGDRLTVLMPNKKSAAYRCQGDKQELITADPAELDQAVTYYHAAAYLLSHGLLRE